MKNRIIKSSEICTLEKLKIGCIAEIVNVKVENLLIRRRLFDMGITKGAVIKIRKIAPLGDPVSFEIRGYELTLRKDELRKIEVRKTA